MRSTQFAGLPPEARELTKNLKAVPTEDPVYGMFGEVCHQLLEYYEKSYYYDTSKLKTVRDVADLLVTTQVMGDEDFNALQMYLADVRKEVVHEPILYREKIQAVPWSSGPVIFLKLVDKDGNDVCVWPQEEIDGA